MSTFRIPKFGSGRDALTLLLITPTRLIRADFEGRVDPALRQIWEARAPAGETLPLLAEAAFLLGAPRKCDVYVLCAGLSMQILSVPVGKVNGLEGEELSNALSFEAEAISGINPFDSALSSMAAGAAGADRMFWVSQMSLADLSQIQTSLEDKDAALRGVAHPGGLPRPLGNTSVGWQRVELWSDAVVAVDGTNGTAPRTNVFNGTPSRPLWQSQVDQFLGADPADRAMMIADSSLIQYATGPTVSLDEEAILKSWLRQWAVEVNGERVRVPLIRPAPKPMPDAHRWALAGALAVSAAVVCGSHYFFIQHQERRKHEELFRVELPGKILAQEKAGADRQQTDLERVNREMRDIHELRQFWKDTLDKEHRRHATLLSTLAMATPAEVAIVSIDEGGGEVRLSGLSLTPEVAGFATNMATALEPFGWRIEPPRRRALNLAADGGPWQLDWSLKSVLPLPLSRTNTAPGGTTVGIPAVVPGNVPAGPTGPVKAIAAGAAAVIGEVAAPAADVNP